MGHGVSVTILVDNNRSLDHLHAEHGFSAWIETGGKSILFDTGQSDLFLENAKNLEMDIERADMLILSHGHYDHTGGISSFLRRNRTCEVYCHPEVFIPRYSRKPDGSSKHIGISEETALALHEIIDRIHWVNTPMFISQDVGITGPIPRVCSFEDTGGDFFLDPQSSHPDPISDDVAMWVNTSQGLVIITGCCHSGVVNTIDYTRKISGRDTIHGILGGLHLLHASTDRLEKTARNPAMISCRDIIPCHCTGDEPVSYLRSALGEKVVPGEVGMRYGA